MFDMSDFEKMKIDLDESFAFRCLECGHCCRNREDIMLSPFDLYRIAQALDMTVDDVIKKYCEVYLGVTSRIPIVRLRPKGDGKVCPLLRKGKCMVHLKKPVVCALYPLGRFYNPHEKEQGYICQKITCGAKDKKQTVREWLEKFGLNDFQKEGLLWNELTIALSSFMTEMEKIAPKACDMLLSGIFRDVYTAYNTDEPFLEQLEERTKELNDIMKVIRHEIQRAS